MEANNRRPSFAEALLADLQDDLKRYGLIKIVPVWILFALGAGLVVALTVPETFWRQFPEERSSLVAPTVVFGALLTVNSLLFALSLNSSSRVFEAINAPKFSAWLDKNGLINTYFFMVQYIHYTQIIALVTSGIALLSTLYTATPLWLDRCLLGLTVATLIYALRYAAGSLGLMEDLIWYRLKFDAEEEQTRARVIPFNNGG